TREGDRVTNVRVGGMPLKYCAERWFCELIPIEPEMVLQKCFPKACADRLDFRAPVVFLAAILLVPVFRQRPSLRLEIHRVCAVLCARARNRILPSHGPPNPGGSLAARSSPTLLQRHTNA